MNRLKRIIPFTFPVWLLFSANVSAELTVIADLGEQDVSPFFEGINRQAPASVPVVSPPPLLQGEAAMLPVSTPEMSPGEVTPRPLQLPG
ncbi:integrating conjugative element protein, partial [Escherichia coli]|uniref:integrating conjugative element protein n=1 Tax=Escherichia coli TaxID=562 RepID=UPI0021581CE0